MARAYLTNIFLHVIIYIVKGVAAFPEAASPNRNDRLDRRSSYFLCFKHREITPTITRQKPKNSAQVTIGITSLHGK